MQNPVMIVDKKALIHNLSAFSALLKGKSEIYAVVKANAYGHGAEEVASFLEPYVAGFAVSTVNEGAALRFAGVRKPILVFTPPTSGEDGLRAKAFSLTLSAGDERSTEICLRFDVCFHIAVNTGMNRYGFTPNALRSCIRRGIVKKEGVEGIYSHLYRADDRRTSEKQRELFLSACRIAEEHLGRGICKHLSATGGILRGEEYYFDLVRLGIGLYGYLPYLSSAVSLKRAMRVTAPVVQTSEGVFGGCGYGKGKGRTTVRFGYADGLFRRAKKGKNGLCMDAFVSEKLSFGEVSVLLDAEKEAKRLKTIPYEVLCSFGERVERIYE